MSTNIHHFKRKVVLDALTIATGSNGYASFGMNFQLSTLSGYTEFTTLFDQYRINRIKVYIVARQNTVSLMEGVNSAVGSIQGIFCTDHDDSSAPSADNAGMNTLRERDKSRSFIFGVNQVYTHALVPATLSEVYRTGVATAYSPKFRARIDCDIPDVPHYGLKGVVRVPLNTGAMPGPVQLDVYATYYITCFDVR